MVAPVAPAAWMPFSCIAPHRLIVEAQEQVYAAEAQRRAAYVDELSIY
jgi:hypothetical protein